ncbi:MAG: polysaccharide biosynthesis protein [Planctomycetota bacterium]|nr:MAG: polysaccharide biosynthesis protein [Planctomycetota bacterium]
MDPSQPHENGHRVPLSPGVSGGRPPGLPASVATAANDRVAPATTVQQTDGTERRARQHSRWLHQPRIRAGMRVAVLLAGFSLLGLAAIRLTGGSPAAYPPKVLVWLLLAKLAAFLGTGGHRIGWRYVTFDDCRRLGISATAGALAMLAAAAAVGSLTTSVCHVAAVDWLGTVCGIGGCCATLRLLCDWRDRRRNQPYRRRGLLLVHKQPPARVSTLLRTLAQRHWDVAGLVVSDAARWGGSFSGVRVLQRGRSVGDQAKRLRARDVLVLEHDIQAGELRRLVDDCREHAVRVHVLPDLEDWLNAARPGRLVTCCGADKRPLPSREVDIGDLLRRPPVELDLQQIARWLEGTTVMVTGAGGSIGSELARQILAFRPARLLLVERCENNLFDAHRRLQPLAGETELVPLIADVGDRDRLQTIFWRWQVETVFHAAAHKHVPMMEWNPGEAIKNNVLGTATVAQTAAEAGVRRFVLISTDKAVKPKSVMGMTKHLAERIVQTLNRRSGTRFVSVRFGNVLGSAGSVVPIFQEQIRNGGPVTVTHPDMERYFMTIPEACQLVLQAAAFGRGGEVFVLDMGQPVKIVDLARDLIWLSGRDPEQIEIVFTGIRPGEKLSEELYFQDEELAPSPHERIHVVRCRHDTAIELEDLLAELESLIHKPEEDIRRGLERLVARHGDANIAPHTVRLPHPRPEDSRRAA